MHFDKAFADFSTKYGMGASFQADRELTILFDNRHAVTFQCDDEDKSVIFSAEICDVGDLARNGFEMLLEASLLGSQTSGAAFAVVKELGKVVLWKRYNNAFDDVGELEQSINRFLAAVITWKQRMTSGPAEGGGAEEIYDNASQMRV
ncbi:MAG: type III secretion system chaperone [Desulfovibrio sp.]|nr:type III secretion system chaperone [Desulfovibrio sp.]